MSEPDIFQRVNGERREFYLCYGVRGRTSNLIRANGGSVVDQIGPRIIQIYSEARLDQALAGSLPEKYIEDCVAKGRLLPAVGEYHIRPIRFKFSPEQLKMLEEFIFDPARTQGPISDPEWREFRLSRRDQQLFTVSEYKQYEKELRAQRLAEASERPPEFTIDDEVDLLRYWMLYSVSFPPSEIFEKMARSGRHTAIEFERQWQKLSSKNPEVLQKTRPASPDFTNEEDRRLEAAYATRDPAAAIIDLAWEIPKHRLNSWRKRSLHTSTDDDWVTRLARRRKTLRESAPPPVMVVNESTQPSDARKGVVDNISPPRSDDAVFHHSQDIMEDPIKSTAEQMTTPLSAIFSPLRQKGKASIAEHQTRSAPAFIRPSSLTSNILSASREVHHSPLSTRRRQRSQEFSPPRQLFTTNPSKRQGTHPNDEDEFKPVKSAEDLWADKILSIYSLPRRSLAYEALFMCSGTTSLASLAVREMSTVGEAAYKSLRRISPGIWTRAEDERLRFAEDAEWADLNDFHDGEALRRIDFLEDVVSGRLPWVVNLDRSVR